MAKLITLCGPDAHSALREIQLRCTVQAQPMQQGCSYSYDHETRTISPKEENSKSIKVFSVVSMSPESVSVIVPFNVAYRLSFLNVNTPAPRPVITAVFNGHLRDYQENSATRVVDMLRTNGRCYLQAPPAYGKTAIIIWTIMQIRERTLIIVPNIGLAEQTRNSFNEMVPDLKIQILGTDRAIDENADVVIAFVRRVCGSSEEFKPFRMVVFDEVHLLTTPIGIAALLRLFPARILAVTATPGARNAITELFVGPCQIREMTDRRWSICFPNIPSDLQGDYTGVEGYTQAMNDLCYSETFINAICKTLVYFVGIGKRVVVLTMRCDMSERIAGVLSQMMEGSQFTFAVLSPDSRKCPNCDVIIGTYKLIGTGFDLANYIENFDGKAASIVVFAGSVRGETIMYQACGRGFRAQDPLAIYPVISGLPISAKHTEILKREAAKYDGCTVLSRYAQFLEHIART